jgi:general secretion pathway protein A
VFGPAPRGAPPWPRAAAVLGLGLAAGAGLYAAANQWLAEPATTMAAATPVRAVAPAPATPAASVAHGQRAAGLVPVVASAPAEPAPVAASSPPELLSDADEAWRELAKSWGVELPAGAAPCDVAQRRGLQCFTHALSLPLIRELGRPGILTLDAGSGSPRYAVLTALTRDTATLRAGGTEQTVTVAALAARWQGAFSTLWKTPPGYTPRAAPTAATIDWMAAGLAQASGATAPTAHRGVDPSLRGELKSFQTAQGLAADGQPGPMTFMQLNRAAGVAEPRLRTGP